MENEAEILMNLVWREQQSRPRNGNNGDLWFPIEIVTVMGELLAGERDFETLSRLNRTSQAIHEETLPVLYETVRIESEEAFTKSLQFANPKWFKYTKYLFLSHTTLAMLRLHQRYLHKFAGHVADGSDLKAMFPKLVLLALSEGKTERHDVDRSPLQVTLYRSINVADMLQACAPTSSIGVTFFGAHLLTPATRQITRSRQPALYRNITRLELESGAHLLQDSDDRVNILSSKRTILDDSSFSLTLAKDTSADDAAYIVRTVLAHLRSYVQAQEKAKKVQPAGGIDFKMSCLPSVFEQFLETFKETQPFYLLVDIELQGMGKSTADMQRYTTSLAEIYASAWTHKPARHGQIFAHIKIDSAVPPEWRAENFEVDDETEEVGNIIGELVVGWEADDADGNMVSHPTGFTAIVVEGMTINGEHAHGEQAWEQAFPVNEVPQIEDVVANDVV